MFYLGRILVVAFLLRKSVPLDRCLLLSHCWALANWLLADKNSQDHRHQKSWSFLFHCSNGQDHKVCNRLQIHHYSLGYKRKWRGVHLSSLEPTPFNHNTVAWPTLNIHVKQDPCKGLCLPFIICCIEETLKRSVCACQF